MVHVPPGWPHQVVNLAPCVKMAWDFYDIEHLTHYVLSRQYIAKYMPKSDDYMGASRLMKNVVASMYKDKFPSVGPK